MPNEFQEAVKEKVKEIQQEVYIKDDLLEKIVGLLLSLRDGKFPSKRHLEGCYFMVLLEQEKLYS